MKTPGPPVFCLRGASAGDAEAMTRLLEGDVELALQTASIPIPYTMEVARKFLDTADPRQTYAVLSGDELVGMIGLVGAAEPVEIGYWIGRPYRGNGYATAAIALLMQEMSERGISRFAAEVVVGNAASMRVLEKSGFVRHGEVERNIPLRGGVCRLIRFQREL